MKYSKKNPPKSPFERGTFTAPLSKGGWGDKNVSHNSENCCISEGDNSLFFCAIASPRLDAPEISSKLYISFTVILPK